MRYTLVVTSCDRHELLRQTLLSFIETADQLPVETFVVEDSETPAPDWIRQHPFRQLSVKWLANDSRRGQIYSIDRAYAEVRTDYVFHCEDDWMFVDSGWLKPSFDILEKYPNVIQVSLRGNTGWHPLADADEIDQNARFKIAQPYWNGVWGGLAFNPGLRRLSDYKRLGSYGKHTAYGTSGLGHEKHLSLTYLDMGYRIADLNKRYVEHTGGECSRAIELLPHLPKILIAIPACHRLVYGVYESENSPHYDPKHQAYGRDIHVSGDNPRIQAVRDTWWKDIEPFKAHVQGKFFYGKGDAEPLDDEVYLSVPDDYASLPFKSLAIFRYALENGYDFVFKCDDDTAVYVDRLIREIIENPTLDYGGYEHSGVCTGGPGYWLSRRAMKSIVDYSPKHWAEDVTVAHALTDARIKPVMLPAHRAGFSAHWIWPSGKFDPNTLPKDAVTMHAVQPDVMRQWHQYLNASQD